MKWIKCADRLPKANHIDTYHCNIRMVDMDESTFPEGVTFSGEWEISENYEVVEWLDESPQPFPGIEEREEGGMIQNHLNKIKALGVYAEIKLLLDTDRVNVLEEFMKSDFYQKNRFDFPKSIITHTKYPEELEEWKEPKETASLQQQLTQATEALKIAKQFVFAWKLKQMEPLVSYPTDKSLETIEAILNPIK